MHEAREGTVAVTDRDEQIGREVVDAALAVHRALGPGLLETAYEACLAEELMQRRLAVERQIGLPVIYGETRVDIGFRLDLLVEKRLVIEIKAIDALASIHTAQVLTYLRFAGLRLGYLINFNTTLLKHGLRRIVL